MASKYSLTINSTHVYVLSYSYLLTSIVTNIHINFIAGIENAHEKTQT